MRAPCLNQKLENLQLAAEKLESGKTFEAPARASVPPSNCQVFVKNSADRDEEGDADRDEEIEANPSDNRVRNLAGCSGRFAQLARPKCFLRASHARRSCVLAAASGGSLLKFQPFSNEVIRS
jgi:hypothetical protein